eukprot:m.77400 g.77400  ORF g.77400 m.77400 type:complete len:77 (-) comp16200_c0_seq1:224-454(-)
MHSSRSKPARKDDAADDDGDEVDPFELRIEKSGCSTQHYAVQDCMDEHKDWRKCQDFVAEFKKCIDANKKSKEPRK